MLHTTIQTEVEATALEIKDVMTMAHLVEALQATLCEMEGKSTTIDDIIRPIKGYLQRCSPKELSDIVNCLNNLGFVDTHGRTYTKRTNETF